MKSLLTIKNLTVGFAKNHHYVPSVAGLNLTIKSGETFALLGESGSGKTLTSLAIMQLLPPTARFMGDSEIFLGEQDLLLLPEIEMQKIRGRRIGMIFQEPMTSLNPVLSIGQQIGEVLNKHFVIRGQEKKQRILELLHEVGLPDPLRQYESFPHQLSGGMKQRAMIAIALAGEPDLLIADEATSALDVTLQAQILQLLKSLQQKRQMAMLFITHDLGVVKQIADRVAVMYAGHLVEQAEKKEFFANPKHPYSKKLFASLPNIKKRKQLLAIIPGQVPPYSEVKHSCRFVTRCDFAYDTCHNILPRWREDNPEHFVRCHLYDPDYAPAGNVIPLPSSQPGSASSTIVDREAIKSRGISHNLILDIKNLKIHFPVQKGLFRRTVGWIKAVDGVNLRIEQGKTLALVGESGCGKTTLAKGVLHLIEPTAGEMHIDSIDVFRLKHRDIKKLRHHAQIIFQDPFSSMNPRMLVGDIIAEGMKSLNIGKNTQDRKLRINELIAQVGLPLDSYYRYPHEFSGGQRQRICIARALAVSPKLIICDEPTSALDVSVQAQILNLLKKLQEEEGLSYLFITHNMAVVAYLADYIAVMLAGKIVEYDRAENILRNPQHAYTKQLLAAVPLVE